MEMMLFTFVMSDNEPKNDKYPTIEIDEGIFPRIGKGEISALDELYHLTERTLYAFTVSLTRDHDQALEVMQETYLKILASAHLYTPMGKPLAWIFTIARNLYYTDVKKNSRISTLDPADLVNDRRFSYVTEAEDKLVLEGLLMKLNEEEREIIMLYAVSGMKHREIADSLNMKLSTVLSKYHRGLKKLRNYLEEEEGRS